MHHKYGKDGFVAVSVALDEKKSRPGVDKFLDKAGADFPCFLLDEQQEVWAKRLQVNGPPRIYVFDRDNRVVKKWPVFDDKEELVEDVNFAAIEKLVADLLKKK